jgi:hypothetical protein
MLIVLSSVRDSVTHSNGFWIGFINIYFKSILITINYSAIANLPYSQITRTCYILVLVHFLNSLTRVESRPICEWLLNQKSKPKSHCDWRSVSKFWCRAPIFITVLQLRSCFCGSVFYICCWSLPAQSFSGPSLLGLATIFYCLRFQTLLFVASSNSQDHGRDIRSRFHTGNKVKDKVKVTLRLTVSQS